jgi:hypothetical protein
MLQNVSRSRQDQKIRSWDLRSAIIAGFLPLYPGKTMFCTSSSGRPYQKPYGHSPIGFIHCVKGRGDGKADVLWQIMYSLQGDSSPWSLGHFGQRPNHNNSVIGYGNDILASSIYKDLKINAGEIKILVEFALIYFYGHSGYGFTDGRSCATVTPREAFGFLLLSPEPKTTFLSGATYFNTVVIFTPRPGLFDETPPS